MNKLTLSALTTTLGVITASTSMALPGGELTTNGGFELGDTSNWASFPTATSTFDVTMDANTGSFAGTVVNVDLAAGAVIKQANIGIGSVEPGDPIRITFAAKGSGEVGGVAFAEFFSELDGGGVSSSEILGGGPLPLTDDWQNFCFTTVAGPNVDGGVSLQFVAATGAAAGSTSTIFIDDASVQIAELTTNGGFESGDTGNWVSFPTATSTFDVTMDSNSGMFAGEVVNNDLASSAVIKQANVGIGVVNPGDTINISFAAKGTFAVGGVAFAEFFSELDGGGVSAGEILGGGPLPLTGDWQVFNFTAIAGPDVSGGVTLQFATVTGGAPGSSANLLVDDASVTTTTGSTINFCTTTPNTVGPGAIMSSSGSPGVAAQDFTLEVSGVPPASFCLFVVGSETDNAPVFDGIRCVGGTTCRLNAPINASQMGTASLALPDSVYTAAGCPPPMVGTRLLFQCAYRDAVPSGGNWSDGLCVIFGE
ncbi:MAG: hypothetical protein AAF726_12430 [Planctomycetota bacterium]